MLIRFIILQTIGAGLILAGYLSGLLAPVLMADHVFALPIILSVAAINLGLVGYGISYTGTVSKWYPAYRASQSALEGATWLSDMLPVLGLILTVYAVLSVVMAATGYTDLDSHRLEIFANVGQALVANAAGMLSYAWVRLTMKVCNI